mgnify:FL=1|tara:strand:+ start:9671 stop:10615 length:945 start_codon:yes stop_codon:yes gene_type:complete
MFKIKPPATDKIYESGEQAEAKGYETLSKLVSRMIRGLFVFKTRKGEIVAASSTFFILMSFLPLMLLSIGVYGWVVGDVTLAHSHVMNLVRDNVPGLAPWILTSLDKIITNHLSQVKGVSVASMAILCYAMMGFSSSLLFGMNTLSSQASRGGKFFEDMRAFLGAMAIACFMFGFTLLNTDLGFWSSQSAGAWWGSSMIFLLRYNILQTTLALSFFSIFYKSFIPGKIRNLDALLGGVSFVALFLLGKSFYWVYLHHMKAEFAATFGNFETIVMAVTWIYFIQCAFFYGASVACAPMRLREEKLEVVPEQDQAA